MLRVFFAAFGFLLFLLYVVSLDEVPAKGPMGPMPTGAKIITEEPEESKYQAQGLDTEKSRQCLAINTYYEARNQSKAGRLATMQVVLNRVYSHHFPDDICGVVTQGPTYTNWLGNEWPVRDQCQFSWYCDGLSDIPVEATTFFEMEELVDEFLSNNMIDFTDGALYYHADYVEPEWKDDYIVTAVIGNHIFYRP
jgi:spore germination cell wall hydrolase CwlJ-like protein